MRILHTSDWHLGQNFYSKSRAAEHEAFLNWLLEAAQLRSVVSRSTRTAARLLLARLRNSERTNISRDLAAATAAGTPTEFASLQRFGHFNGSVKREGVVLGNVTGASVTYKNNLDRIETIRADGKIDGADPTISELTGKLMLNENTFLQGGASMRVTIGGEAPDGAQADGDAEPWTLEEAVRALSRRLYRQLDEQTKKSISDGL